ncbi:hypothetical protein HanXRQr2_Chr01g0004861 [Helianthus annuus]|uniref:Uncharacterized protein n=1 Tax=Helianthus annuus TaxID=4232 RepID=A0A251UPI8_HELAN|nr:hypothetical protein HanXRQr2_Chr01g0004861 [Helianthus annuus]KAJ0955603.1 hypothetical protein HanPSC8_Chr01g0004711 [Helianthus annuus]
MQLPTRFRFITNCYTIETIKDGKPLRGVLFSNNPYSKKSAANDLRRKSCS